MKRVLFSLLTLGLAHGAHADPVKAAAVQSQRALGTQLRVADGGWGSVSAQEVERVLASVIQEFGGAAHDVPLPPVLVRHHFGSPLISYDRALDGAYVIWLSARNDRWYQYVYQFSHELCHLLSRFDLKEHDGEVVRENQWFEESLCETASLYALRRLAANWAQSDADQDLQQAAPLLAKYADTLLAQPHRELPAGLSMSAWFAQNEDQLRREPYLRELNELVAAQILPLFERNPELWRALAYLNVSAAPAHSQFYDYLALWRAAAPQEFKPFVAELESLFGVGAPVEHLASLPGIKSR